MLLQGTYEPPGTGPAESTGEATANVTARRGPALWVAVLVVVGVPTALVLSLWGSLTGPLWFNEQWRAFEFSLPGNWWRALRVSPGPIPAGWFFLERGASDLFGSTELSLRLPTSFFLPLGCLLLFLLARRWMPLSAAVVVSLVGCLTGDYLAYSVQVSEYTVDMAAVLGILFLHELAGDFASRRARCYLAYAGIGLACLFSSAAVFIAGPLLLFDVYRDVKRGTRGPQFIGAIGAGAVALAHLGIFVMRQGGLTESSYWDGQFLPHRGVARQLSFLWNGAYGFVAHPFTDSSNPRLSSFSGAGSASVVAVIWIVLLCLGVSTAIRSRDGRSLLVALVGSFSLCAVASYFRHWPYGFVRTNLYEVPILVLLAGIGATGTIRNMMSASDEARKARHFRRNSPPRLLAVIVTVVLFSACVFSVAVAGSSDLSSYRHLRAVSARPGSAYGDEIGEAVAAVRLESDPESVVIVAGNMAIPGWGYYQYEYSGRATQTGTRTPVNRTLFVTQSGSPVISRFVMVRHPNNVFIYVPAGATGAQVNSDIKAATGRGVCQGPVVYHSFPGSGLLIEIGPCSTSQS